MPKAAHRSHAAPSAERLEGLVVPDCEPAPATGHPSTAIDAAILAAIPAGGCRSMALAAKVHRTASYVRQRLTIMETFGLIKTFFDTGSTRIKVYCRAGDVPKVEHCPRGLSGMPILRILAERGTGTTMATIATATGTVPGGALHYYVTNLLAEGYVRRFKDAGARGLRYTLTAKGRRAIKESSQ